MRHVQKSIPQSMQELKGQALQSYELARTAAQPGKKLSMTGPLGADADYHIQNQNDYLRMIAFVRLLERNDPIISSARRRLRDNVNVGQMTPNPQTGSDTLNEHLKGLWQEYSNDPDQFDATGRFTFEEAADITYVRTIFDGDLMAVPEGDTGKILHLEGHRCQTPTLSRANRGVCGVQTNDKGQVENYYLTKRPVAYGAAVRVADVEAIPARNRDGWKNVFHVYQPDRFSLNRGVTSLAPVGTAAARRDDLEFAQILQAQVAACITLVEEMNDSNFVRYLAANGAMPDMPLPDTFAAKDDAGFELKTAALHPGRVLQSRPGYQLKVNNGPNIGGGMFQLNDLLIEYMAMCLDLPSIVLRLDAKNANFSQFRHVLDQARFTYGKHQRWCAAKYHRQVYRNLIRCRAASDKLIRDFVSKEGVLTLQKSKALAHEWNAVGWKYPHPVDDAMGDILLLSSSMQSLEQYSRKQYGFGADELIRRVVADNKRALIAAINAAEEIFKETGVRVDWQYLFPPATRNGINIQMNDQPAGGMAAEGVGAQA